MNKAYNSCFINLIKFQDFNKKKFKKIIWCCITFTTVEIIFIYLRNIIYVLFSSFFRINYRILFLKLHKILFIYFE